MRVERRGSGLISKRQRTIWAWAVDDLVRLQGDEPRSSDYRWDAWESRRYVTEIFNADQVPAVDDLLIGAMLDGDKQVVAIGRVDSSAGVATRRMRTRISPILHLRPIRFEDLGPTKAASRRMASGLRVQALRPQPLSAEMAQELMAALEHAAPELRAWLSQLAFTSTEVVGDEGLRLREERDAIQLGVELADLRIPDSESAIHVPQQAVNTAMSFLNPDLFEDNEDDLLFADLRRFSGDGVLAETSGSTSIYHDGEVTLLIANVNRKPVEHLLGVDLLYWDQTVDSYTLLQYKRLTKVPKPASNDMPQTWRYTRRGELEQQLAKMERIDLTPAADARDWRFVTSPFWFKFVRGDAFTPDDRDVLQGLYVPAEYLRIGMENDAFTGPNGGFALYSGNARFINREPFVQLVRRHFTGSTRATGAQIAQLLNRNPDREVVVIAKKDSADSR